MKRLKKGDVILLLLIVVLCLIAASFYLFAPLGDSVVIYCGDLEYARVPLDTSKQIVLNQNGHENTIEIKDGAVAMAYANCPDGLCMRQGAIKNAAQIIVCLPNAIIVKIEPADKPADALDGISW